jgi:hypothetical protein
MIDTKVGSFEPESRLLIDGELVDAASGARFDNINPATEEVLGQVADGGHEDMQRAIGAARRAFDETDWPVNRAFRAKCLEQLQEALEADKEQLRAELVAETGTPVLLTYGPQLDTPLQEAYRWPANNIEQPATCRRYGSCAARPRCRQARRPKGYRRPSSLMRRHLPKRHPPGRRAATWRPARLVPCC